MQKVLIVDDEPALRFLISSSLEDEGYQLLVAADGRSAWEQAQADRPDLIILDVMMPGLSGLELAATRRDDPATANVAVCARQASATGSGAGG